MPNSAPASLTPNHLNLPVLCARAPVARMAERIRERIVVAKSVTVLLVLYCCLLPVPSSSHELGGFETFYTKGFRANSRHRSHEYEFCPVICKRLLWFPVNFEAAFRSQDTGSEFNKECQGWTKNPVIVRLCADLRNHLPTERPSDATLPYSYRRDLGGLTAARHRKSLYGMVR